MKALTQCPASGEWRVASDERSSPLVTHHSSLITCLPILFTAVVLTCGCTSWREYIHNGFKVGPNYGRPPAPVAKDWIDAADARVRKDPDDLSRWWTVFNDPVLDALI